MTYKTAMQKLSEDREVLLRALSTLETARALHSIGEEENALTVGASAWFSIRMHYRKQWEMNHV